MQGLERQLELHPSVSPPFTPLPPSAPLPAPLPVLQAKDVTVESQERMEYIEHDGQLQHMDNGDQQSYVEAVGQSPVTVQVRFTWVSGGISKALHKGLNAPFSCDVHCLWS